MKRAIKEVFVELLDPIKNYMRMGSKSMHIVLIFVPAIIGIMTYIIGTCKNIVINENVILLDFMADVLGNFITVIALFISFSMAYLSMIISSSSTNIDELKKRFSEKYFDKQKRAYTLYQILITHITYSLIIEIAFLIICILERFLINCISNNIIKMLCSMNIAVFVYILFIMLQIVKNIYYSFWKSR